MQSHRWTTVLESEYPWERDALEYVRALLPDADPFRAWANFEFIADDGSINEVDLLVVSLYRVYLVEIKSAPGRVEGDAGTWTWTDGARTRSTDNPLLLANRKAKKLKSLLQHQAAMRNVRMPYLEAVVFLSHPAVRCGLDGAARSGVLLRAETERDGYPDVGRVLRGDVEASRGGSAVPGSHASGRIDGATGRALVRAVEQAGIRATQRGRQVGDYHLDRLLAETDVYQDWEATHVRFAKTLRRVRIYPNALASPETTRAERQRAAEREFRLLDGIAHSGIVRVDAFTEHERGPALVFEHFPEAERLDFYLQGRGRSLDLRGRLALVRQIAETLQYAHARRLYHRTLTPQSVLVVDPASEAPTLKLFNWQAGETGPGSETTTRLTVHHIVRVGLAGEAEGAVYLAPELYSVGTLDPARLDVFSLGTLAYSILSGAVPAASIEALHEKIARDHGLRLSEAFDGVDEDLEALVQMATDPDTSGRPEIADFLADLDEVMAQASAPDAARYPHPLDAAEDAELEGGFVVERRLGKGSTALALLVRRGEQEGVLKVALEPEANERLLFEAEVLGGLRHQNVVELYDTVMLSGHVALFMAAVGTRRSDGRAGSYTLAQRLREEGRLSLDLLQRFGEELLVAVDWLEGQGISHRDIKPDNIGIGQSGKKSLTLVLFDFSLSGASSENIRAGTPPYLDPFLPLRKPPRYDVFAEHFAAAVTLYEMATGQVPTWGDGLSNPALVDDEVAIDAELFDASVREGLVRFFEKALARDFKKRYDNAEEMRRAWGRVFEGIDQPTTDLGSGDLDAALAEATEATELAALPLSARVLNAIERMGVTTLGALLEMPRIRLYRNRGIGQQTVREVRRLAERAAEVLAGRSGEGSGSGTGVGLADPDPSADPALWSIDLMHRRLLSRQASEDERAILTALLGLEETAGAPWAAQQDVAERLGCARDEVRQATERARERWRKDVPMWMQPLREDVARLLEKHGGVMTQRELAASLLAIRGSAAANGERARRASAVAYAAVEVEAAREGARLTLYRGRDHVFVVATPALGDAYEAAPASRARYAEALGAAADALAAEDPLPSPERVVEALQAIEPPGAERPLPSDRLLRLATGAARSAALSSRMELYPRRMAATRALKLGAGSLLGARALTPEDVQARLSSRYPEAEPLPARPALDALLAEIGLAWNGAQQHYTPSGQGTGATVGASSLTRRSTTAFPQALSAGAEAALALEARLEQLGRRLLVLTVTPEAHEAAASELARRFGLVRVSLEGLLLREMRTVAKARKVDWDLVLRADGAEPESRDARNLRALVGLAVEAVEAALLKMEQPALLVLPGMLARYGRLDLVDRLRAACEAGRAPGFVLLVAADAQSTMPVIDHTPLPVVHASDWARIPRAWVRNEHRARRPEAPVGEAAGVPAP